MTPPRTQINKSTSGSIAYSSQSSPPMSPRQINLNMMNRTVLQHRLNQMSKAARDRASSDDKVPESSSVVPMSIGSDIPYEGSDSASNVAEAASVALPDPGTTAYPLQYIEGTYDSTMAGLQPVDVDIASIKEPRRQIPQS